MGVPRIRGAAQHPGATAQRKRCVHMGVPRRMVLRSTQGQQRSVNGACTWECHAEWCCAAPRGNSAA